MIIEEAHQKLTWIDFQFNWKFDCLENFRAAFLLEIEALQVKDKDDWKLFQSNLLPGGNFLIGSAACDTFKLITADEDVQGFAN